MNIDYKKYIEINHSVRFGKPVIKDTRITVYDIINMLANDMSIDEILYDFPDLTKEQVKACIFYVSDRERILSIAL
ncbi:MAG: hypothetical protein QG635_347 [Bacteroidota bacterium]|nr:hypothetical protein [Bacteroidota bacterium]